MGILEYTCGHTTNISAVTNSQIPLRCERCLRLRRDAQLFDVSTTFDPAIERAERAARDFNSGSLDQLLEVNGRVLDLKLERRKAEDMVRGWHVEKKTTRRAMVEAVC